MAINHRRIAKRFKETALASKVKKPKKLLPYLPSKTTPWPQQKEAYSFFAEREASMLWMKMASGKGKLIVDLISSTVGTLNIVIAPLYVVKTVWPLEFATHSATLGKTIFIYQKWSIDKKAQVLKEALKSRGDKRLTVVLNLESAKLGKLRRVILSQQWDLGVVDESHLSKGHSQTAKFLLRLGMKATKRISLTGTLTPYAPTDVYGQWLFLDREVFGTVWQTFRDRYVDYDTYQGVKGYKRLNELARKVAPYIYFSDHSKFKGSGAKLPKELPPVVRKCTLSPQGQKMYTELEKSFITLLPDGSKVVNHHVLERNMQLLQIAHGYVRKGETIQEVDGEKELLLQHTLEECNGDPVVVFYRFTHNIKTIQRVCKKLGLGFSLLSGNTDTTADWKKGKTDILACQTSKGAGGDFTRSATPLFFSCPKNSGDHDQCKHRLIRPTSKHKYVKPIHLIVEGTLDEDAYNALRNQTDMLDEFSKRINNRVQE